MFTLDISDDDILEAQKRYLSHTDMRRKESIPLFTGWRMHVEILVSQGMTDDSQAKINWLWYPKAKSEKCFFGKVMWLLFPEKVIYFEHIPTSLDLDRLNQEWKGDTIITNLSGKIEDRKMLTFLSHLESKIKKNIIIWILINELPQSEYLSIHKIDTWMIGHDNQLVYITKNKVLDLISNMNSSSNTDTR